MGRKGWSVNYMMMFTFYPAREEKMTSYNQLTYGVRCQIYALKKTGMSQNMIARQRRVNQSTISRELLRNPGQRGYRYKQAHDMAIARRLNTPKAFKIKGCTKHLIEEKIREDWSPEQISGWLARESKCQVSHQTIYEPIWADKRCGGLLFQHLRRKGKAYTPRNKDKQAGRGFIKNRVSIDERLSTVDEKTRIVIGKLTLLLAQNTVVHC